jgi:hypothetical protein
MKKKTSSKDLNLIEPGFKDPVVESALSLIGRNSTIHNKHESVWRQIQELFEAGFFTINNPTGTKTISSKLLLQILWKTANKLKIPDTKLYRSGPFAIQRDPKKAEADRIVRSQVEEIVTAGVATVIKEGKFLQCMRDKGGVFYKMSLFGDAHLQVGYDNDNSDYPIRFRLGSLSDTYMNNSCTEIRDPVGGLSADEMVVIYRYTMKQFDEDFPVWKGKVAKGEIPRAYRYKKQLEKTWLQTIYDPEDIIEVAYRIGIDKKMVVFAGSACTVLDKLEGDPKKDLAVGETDKSFPYIMDGKPYIPIIHFKFFPSSEGYYNYGIGHMLCDLAVVMAKMDNMAYSHAGDNIWPINFVNSSQKKTSQLFQDILQAQKVRDAGGRGWVVSDNPQGGSGVSVESFQSQPITTEWERAFNRLEKQIERMGFHLDSPDLGANPNEMSIMADQEETDAPIKQVVEWNTTAFEEVWLFAMDAIRKFVADDDMTPINSTTELGTAQENTDIRQFPLGWVAEELRKNRYFVVVNSRDGTVPSGVMQKAEINQSMQDLPPGTPAWNKLAVQRAKLNGQDVKLEDLSIPAPAGAPQAQSPGGQAPLPTETSPLDALALKYPNIQK